jgi:hypothetical protein
MSMDMTETTTTNGSEKGLRNAISPEPPYLWPEHRIFTKQAHYKTMPPWVELLRTAQSLCGLVTELAMDGVDLLRNSLSENEGLRVKIILVLYPACTTTEEEMAALLGLQQQLPERLEVRLYLLDTIEDIPYHSLMVVPMGTGLPTLLAGPAGNLGLEERRPDRVNMAITPDAAATEAWSRWFNWLWASQTSRLRRGLEDIPRLVRPRGTEEARLMWEAYMSSCHDEDDDVVMVVVDEKTGDVEVTVRPETLTGKSAEEQRAIREAAQQRLPTVVAGIPKLDAAADLVARLFRKGSAATIDKSTRVKPFAVPISPRFFGMEAEEREGRVAQKVSYSIAIFDEVDQKKIENLRKSISDVLRSLSYPLADGLRWVPDTAKDLLRREIEARNREAQEVLGARVTDINSFLSSIEPGIRQDAEKMVAKLALGVTLSNSMFDKIMKEISLRLQAAMGGERNLLPAITYAPFGFQPGHDSPTTSPWGNAYKLLFAVAQYPAEVAKGGKFFERGYKACSVDEVVKGMDVLGHAWFHDEAHRHDWNKAKEEWLPLLTELDEEELPLPEKCKVLLGLIRTGKITVA